MACFACCRFDDLAKVTYEETEKFVLPVSRGKVVKVYDGDTITIAFRMQDKWYRTQVRLSGIDTPEIKGKSEAEKVRAREARDALHNRIIDKVVELRNVGTEKYGRLLAEVWYEDENICEWMLAQGYAVAYHGGTKNVQL